MLDYCPNCRCKIKFYKSHECEKMKHELAGGVKLAGDVIASSDECKLKENTTHGIFRIWCVLKNIIEIICDIIKRMIEGLQKSIELLVFIIETKKIYHQLSKLIGKLLS